ncbi:TPR-like protein [Neolentinus lepideus HHB14362 ss-1]|uniref:TPR-like protein n=1 Tax=Neolentinus lepideus HHB14362 ss-1 TaxID=1314782 RepID=A0A165P4J8_9AGAM|nr:TPR-like protein [Neolentinus lepideus HHB14362 ss-1]
MNPTSKSRAKYAQLPLSVDDLEAKVAERAAQRATGLKARIEDAEKYKEKGNEWFRQQKYEDALHCYQMASSLRITEPIYACNAAAAFLKLERYEWAESVANEALRSDPSMQKARYRRGLARKGMERYRAAMFDFRTVLEQDPACDTAKDELAIVEELLEAGDGVEEYGEYDEDRCIFPPLNDGPLRDWDNFSDSSDYWHDGNMIPCRHYNHAGCKKGSLCKYSHAPDAKSVRDKLGRNICVYHIFDECKFGDARCVYSHDLQLLPDDWLSLKMDPRRLGVFRVMYRMGYTSLSVESRDPLGETWENVLLPEFCKVMLDALPADIRDKWEITRGVYDSIHGPSQWIRYGKGNNGRRQREAREKAVNFGFTLDEVEELLTQGLKPWDKDAHAAVNRS